MNHNKLLFARILLPHDLISFICHYAAVAQFIDPFVSLLLILVGPFLIVSSIHFE